MTKETHKVLVRYRYGRDARPELIQDEDELLKARIVERLVDVSDTFLRDGVRYYRLVIGHGDVLDIPCSLSSSL